MQKQSFLRQIVAITLISMLFSPVFGQNEGNEATKVENETVISAGEKFDLIFQRGLLLNVGAVDSVPFDATSSGSVSLGFSYGIPLGRVAAFKFEPRITWHTLNYKMESQKRFPSIGDSALVYEKHRNVYLEMGTGFKINLVRNAEEKVKLFLELGGFAGFEFSNFFKVREEQLDGAGDRFRVTTKYHTVEGTEPLRYGLYGRFGTNWIAMVVQYRMSNIFKDTPVRTYLFPGRDYTYPKFSNLEIGFTVKL